MDSNGTAQGVVATILIIPLLTVAHIILAAIGCFTGYFIVRAVFRVLGGKVKDKAKKFGSEVKQEANRLRAEKVQP
jgi:hypothetical protein